MAAGDYLMALMSRIRTVALEATRELAKLSGCLPALYGDGHACAEVMNGKHTAWSQRWRAAVDKHAIRNRNLIVLSPWSVFPSVGDPDGDYKDLLPLLRFADACVIPEPPRSSKWNISEFIALHQRAWAVLEKEHARELIAEQA